MASRGNRSLHLRAAGGQWNDQFTKDDWRDLLLCYGYACAYCGRTDAKLTKDHIIPLGRGGKHEKENILPCCEDCNHEKGDRTLDEWLEDQEIERWEEEYAG